MVEGADWCGQCYTPLKTAPDPAPDADDAPDEPKSAADVPPLPILPAGLLAADETDPETAEPAAQTPLAEPAASANATTLVPHAAPEAATGRVSTWTCPSCDRKNPLALELCAMCATPFSRLFDEGPAAKPVDPERAARASILPGLGHWMCGERGEAATRFLFVLWGISVGLLALLAKSDAAAKIHPVGAVYIISALAVYVIGFFDAHRAASGHEQLLSVKILLYWFAALIFIFLVSVFAAFLSVTKDRGVPGGGTSPVP